MKKAIFSCVKIRMNSSFLVAAFLFLLGGTGHVRAAGPTVIAYDETGRIASQTLTKDKSPYTVPGGCANNVIPQGSTLIIEAGVVIRFKPPEFCNGLRPTQLLVYGSIRAQGTAGEPVVFTSWYDREHAKSDVAPSDPLPAPGDWGRIQIGGSAADSEVHLEHVEFRYGGGNVSAMLPVTSPAPRLLVLGHLTFASSSSYGITTYVPLELRNSRFWGNVLGAINADPAPGAVPAQTVRAEHSWWGHATGPLTASNPAGQGQKITGNVTYRPWIGGTVSGTNPVIIIPGILGTEMKMGDELVWANVGKMVADRGDDFMKVLKFKDATTPLNTAVKHGEVLRSLSLGPKRMFDYLDSFIQDLVAAGYKENETLFLFPYDWRSDVRLTSQELDATIKSVLARTGAQKVDIVSHSLGGLIAKHYLYTHPSAPVDMIIYAGTPHLGAPETVKTLLIGDDFGMRFGVSFLSRAQMRDIGRTLPAAYQLLPSAAYHERLGSYLRDDAANKDFTHSEAVNFLVAQGLKRNLFTVAAKLHTAEFEAFTAKNTASYSLVGCSAPTVGKIHRKPKAITRATYTFTPTAGDGTVPTESAAAGVGTTVFYGKSVIHNRMLSQAPTRKLILQLLDGTHRPELLPETIRQTPEACVISGRLITAQAPAVVHVYTKDGQHAGPTADGGQDVIDEVLYTDFGDATVAFVPDDPNFYDIRLVSGEFGSSEVKISQIQASTVTKTTYYEKVTITPHVIGAVTDEDTLVLEDTASGAHIPVDSSAQISGHSAGDDTPPRTSLATEGVRGSGGWFRSAVTTTLSAVDDGSGVGVIYYSLDLGTTWQRYHEPFTVTQEGVTRIWYYSRDLLGNEEGVQKTEVKIDMTSPEVIVRFASKSAPLFFDGIDTFSTTTVHKNDSGLVISDTAGNTTVVTFSDELRQTSALLRLKSISYSDGRGVLFPENRSDVRWSEQTEPSLASYLEIVFNDMRLVSHRHDQDSGSTIRLSTPAGRLKAYLSSQRFPYLRITTLKP